MLCEEAKSRLFLTTPDGFDSALVREFDAQVVCRWNGFHGVQAWGSHDHVTDGGLIDLREIDDFVDSLGHNR